MKTLGLDIGTTSIGFALIEDQTRIITAGSYIFPVGVQHDTYSKNGREESKAIQRRTARMARRMNERAKLRRHHLQKFFAAIGWPTIPATPDYPHRIYEWRSKGLDQRLEREEFMAILFLMAKRRGFKSSRKSNQDQDGKKASDLVLEMQNFEQIIEQSGARTLGEYFFRQFEQPVAKNGTARLRVEPLSPTQKIRKRHFTRKLLIHELDCLWQAQAIHHPELTPERLIQVRDQIIFYQRKLKSARHLVRNCPFEPKKKALPKSHPLFQRFRLWQMLNNLEVSEQDDALPRMLTLQEKRILFEAFAQPNDKEEAQKKEAPSPTKAKELLGISKKATFNRTFELLSPCTTRIRITKALGYDPGEAKLLQYWDALFFFDDPEKLRRHFVEKRGLDHETAERLAKVNLEPDYGSLSHKAIAGYIDRRTGEQKHGILYWLEQGYTYSEACENNGYQFQAKGEQNRWPDERLPLLNLQHILEEEHELDVPNSPLVRRVISETLRLVRQVCAVYGRPDAIHIELARSLQKNKAAREEIYKQNNLINQRRNAYRDFLAERGLGTRKSDLEKFELWLELQCHSQHLEQRLQQAGEESSKFEKFLKQLNPKDTTKWRLWLECDRVSVYTGKVIPLHRLFSQDDPIEIEHIIPYSFSQDNSFANLTLAEKSFNQAKGRETGPLEYFKTRPEAERKAFIDRVKRHFADKSPGKAARLLLDLKYEGRELSDLSKKELEKLQKFRPDHLAATAYANRTLMHLLSRVCPVLPSSGGVTAQLRHEWGLNALLAPAGVPEEQAKKNREDHRHHALDAIVIAFTNRSMIQRLSTKAGNPDAARIDRLRNGHISLKLGLDDKPEDIIQQAEYALQHILVAYRKDLRLASTRRNPYRHLHSQNPKPENKTLAPRGPLHNETIYGQNAAGQYITTKSLKDLKEPKKLHDVVDPILREKLIASYPFTFDDGQKCYLGKDGQPVRMPRKDGQPGPLILSVRIARNVDKMVELPRGYAEPDNNFGVALYEGPSGARGELVVTFEEAFQNLKNQQPIFPDVIIGETGGRKRLPELLHRKVILQINDMVLLGDFPDDSYLLDPQNRSTLSQHLYRVQKLSSIYYVFRHHLASTQKHDEQMVRVSSLGNMNLPTGVKANFQLVKVRLNAVGHITQILERL